MNEITRQRNNNEITDNAKNARIILMRIALIDCFCPNISLSL